MWKAVFERHWPLGLAVLSGVASALCAAAVLVDMRRAAGGDLVWSAALAWQGAIYATWAPFVWWAARLVRRLGLSARMLRALYPLTLASAAAHAALVLWVNSAFDAGPPSWRSLEERAPIDLLMATAISAAVIAVRAQRLAAEEARRAADLASALEAARTSAEPSRASPPTRLLVSTGAKRTLVDLAEVEWFAAAANYVVVNWNGREGLIRETLNGLAARLDPAVFVRSHRSTVVNLAKVIDAACLADGSWRVTLCSGAELVVSRTYRDQVLSQLRAGSG